MTDEHTGEDIAALAGRLMRHEDIDVRRLAASALTQAPDHKASEEGIGWALKQLWNGKRVARWGWNGKGMWLRMQSPDANSKMTLPYIYIEYPAGHPAYENGCRVPWLASQTDLLALDWIVLFDG